MWCSTVLRNTKVFLNDNPYSSPDCSGSLVGLLSKFGKFLVAVTADIDEVFLRVKVIRSDWDHLSFLWFDNSPCGSVRI